MDSFQLKIFLRSGKRISIFGETEVNTMKRITAENFEELYVDKIELAEIDNLYAVKCQDRYTDTLKACRDRKPLW